MAIIELNKLSKNYGEARGIIDVNLTVSEGEIFGFIGPNGAGKSTTIRTLLNFIYPTSGTATIFGKDCTKQSRSIKYDIGYVPSEINYYKEMKVSELLIYSLSFFKHTDKSYLEMLCDQFEVEYTKQIGELSLGNRKKVAIVQALAHKPRLLILDEPTIGLDPLMQNRLFEVLELVNKSGTTIFMSSHNLSEVQKFCSKVAIIRAGRILLVKKMEELLGDYNRKITVKTKENIVEKLSGLGIQNIKLQSEKYTFLYNGAIDTLIKHLAKYVIDDILIEEVALEDKFINFYEGDGEGK